MLLKYLCTKKDIFSKKATFRIYQPETFGLNQVVVVFTFGHIEKKRPGKKGPNVLDEGHKHCPLLALYFLVFSVDYNPKKRVEFRN